MESNEEEVAGYLALRKELRDEQKLARAKSRKGLKLLIGLPAVFFLSTLLAWGIPGVPILLALVLTGVYALTAGIGGFAMITSATMRHQELSQQIEVLDEQRLLPEARVLRP